MLSGNDRRVSDKVSVDGRTIPVCTDSNESMFSNEVTVDRYTVSGYTGQIVMHIYYYEKRSRKMGNE
jgi:hypothetical protein